MPAPGRRRPHPSLIALIVICVLAATPVGAAGLGVAATRDGLVVRGDATSDRLTVEFPEPDVVVLRSARGAIAVASSASDGRGAARCSPGATMVRCEAPAGSLGMRLRIATGAGNDRVRFRSPSTVQGGILAPVVDGGPGRDVLTGDGTLIGGPGDDVIRVVDGVVSSALIGGPGNDLLRGGGGDDVLMGGRGRDRLVDLGGVNRFIGGANRDVVVLARRLTPGSASVGGFGRVRAGGLDTVHWDVERVRSVAVRAVGAGI